MPGPTAVNARFDHLETQLTAIEDNGNKVVWIVLTAVIGAVVLFMMKGGLHQMRTLSWLLNIALVAVFIMAV